MFNHLLSVIHELLEEKNVFPLQAGQVEKKKKKKIQNTPYETKCSIIIGSTQFMQVPFC